MPAKRNPIEPTDLLAENNDGASDAESDIAYVQMVRDPEIYPEPHSAQVHPDEVENYRPGGWEIDDVDGSTER